MKNSALTRDNELPEKPRALRTNPDISVIVPVYNVVDYLEKCVESLLAQNHSNYEILLIDDGSTDESGSICDCLAHHHSNIHAFHKLNGGLSDARNFGLNMCRGEYVTFVDSDDTVSPQYLSFLHEAVEDGAADISTCQYVALCSKTPVQDLAEQNLAYECCSGSDALASLLYGRRVNVAAWGKLYKKSLFEHVSFPKGRHYEDVGTTYKLIRSAKRVAISQNNLYFYLNRPGSITNQEFSESTFDRYLLAKEAFSSLRSDAVLCDGARAYFCHHTLAMLRNVPSEVFSDQIEAIRLELTSIASQVFSDKRVCRKDKVALFLFLKLGARMYSKCWRLFQFIGGNSK